MHLLSFLKPIYMLLGREDEDNIPTRHREDETVFIDKAALKRGHRRWAESTLPLESQTVSAQTEEGL